MKKSLWTLLGLNLIFFTACAASNVRPKSDHYNGKVFFNPTLSEPHRPSFWSVIKLWMAIGKAEWPRNLKNEFTPRLHEKLAPNQVAITFVNHATMLIQLPGLNILTDPVWAKRASPLSWAGPERVREPGIKFEDLPKIDLVIVSHNHYDHFDLETLEKLQKRFSPKFLIAVGDRRLAEKAGLKDFQEMDWWDQTQVNPETQVTFTPTQHFSARGLFDRDESLWGSYMIRHQNRLIYFGGDSGYSSHYKEINKRFGAVDLAFIPIGAYEPRSFMKDMHVNPQEAVKVHQELQARRSIAIHFGTFRLSTENENQPVQDLKKAMTEAGVSEKEFIVLREGQTEVYTLNKGIL